MSDAEPERDEEAMRKDAVVEEGASPRAGERLAAARREKQLSVAEIAKELHIDEYKVRALERNAFESLGAPVFAKGHLRKYAQLVEVSIDDILADYYALNQSVGPPPLVGRTRRPPREINLGRWLAVLLLLLLAAGAWWWFVERDAPARPETSPVGSTAVSLPTAGSMRNGANETPASAPSQRGEAGAAVNEAGDGTAGTESAPTPATATPPASNPRPGAGAGGSVQLAVRYSGDCWTEITDASGERLFFGLGRDGRTVEVSGEAPVSVLFGNADHVQLTVNGAAHPIPAANRRGLTARLTLQAP